MALKNNVVIRESPIHGFGVFTQWPLRKDDVVLTWNPTVLTPEAFAALPPAEKEYVSHVDGKILLMDMPERYVNHSCDPNTRVDPARQADIALRAIREEEEITTDASPLFPKGFRKECLCGSPKCRGFIVGSAPG